jgi:peptidylprolyl isomerase
MKKIALYVLLILILAVAGLMGYQYFNQPELGPVPDVPPESSSLEQAPSGAALTSGEGIAGENPILQIEVAGQANGMVEIELLADVAPAHVARIVELAKSGSYDNVVFHRVIEGFMAQTGDVQYGKRDGGGLASAGMGASDLPDLKAEISELSYTKGTVGMARGPSLDSANAQFFIVFDDASFLDNNYTIIGRVISGQEIIDQIKKGDPNANGSVSAPDYMKSVRIKGDG